MELNVFLFNHVQVVVFGTLLLVNVYVPLVHSGMEIFAFNAQEVKLIKLMLDASVPMEHFMMDQNVPLLPLINALQLLTQFGMEMPAFVTLDFQLLECNVFVKAWQLVQLTAIVARTRQALHGSMEFANVMLDFLM